MIEKRKDMALYSDGEMVGFSDVAVGCISVMVWIGFRAISMSFWGFVEVILKLVDPAVEAAFFLISLMRSGRGK